MRRLLHERLEDRRLLAADLNLDFTASFGGVGDEAVLDSVADEAGFLYVVGRTEGSDLPVLGGPGSSDSTPDVFVAKYDTQRKDIVFARRLGGAAADYGSAISLDATGQITISGYTHSADFPWVNPAREPNTGNFDAPSGCIESFVARISADGDDLLFATPVGGSGRDKIYDHAITPDGRIVVVGDTDSLDYPTTTGAFQERSTEAVLYRSADAAASWQLASVGLHNSAVLDIAIDPTDANIVYAALNSSVVPNQFDTAYAPLTYGVYKSTDGGQTWAATGGVDSGLMNKTVTHVLINPVNPQIVYAGTEGDYVWRSTDGGATWNQASNGIDYPIVYDLEISPSDPDVLYLSTLGGLQRTVDGGDSWTRVVNSPPVVPPINEIAIDADDPSTIYASRLAYGLLKSLDGGVTWQDVTPLYGWEEIRGLWADPVTPQVVYAVRDDFIVGPNDAGLVKSVDGGASWTHIISGLPPTRVTSFAVDPTDPSILYSGISDEVYKSIDGGLNWSVTGGLPQKDITTLDASGNTVLAGSLAAYGDSFVTVLSSDAATVLASTYLGSEGRDNAAAVTADASGIYVTGNTLSSVPLTRGPADFGPLVNTETSVVKLSHDLANVEYVAFLDSDPSFSVSALDIAVDQWGQAHVVGGGGQVVNDEVANRDGIVWKLSNDGSSALYTTTIGGAATDDATDIAVDHMGYAYVSGYRNADSTGFPEASPIQPGSYGGGESDAFVAQLDPAGQITMSSSLGGAGSDYGDSVTVSPTGDVYYAGKTNDVSWISNPHEPTDAAQNEVFIAKVSLQPYSQLPASYEQRLRDYAAVTARYFMSAEANNLGIGFPHSWYGTGPFRDCTSVGQCTEAAWELNRGYGSYTVINEVTLRLNVLAVAPRMDWADHLPEGVRYERTWDQVVTGLQTLRAMQTSGDAQQYADGAFYRFYLTADNTPAAADLTVEQIRRVTHEQSADDNALSYLNLLQLKGLTQSANSGVTQEDGETIVALIDDILGDMDLRWFIHDERILHSKTDGQPTVDPQTQTIQYWDRIAAEGSLILAAMLASEQIAMDEFQTLAATLENYPVQWTTDGGQQIPVTMPSYHSAAFMHSLRPVHGMPVTDRELPGLTYYRESTVPIMQSQLAFADFHGFEALGSQVMSQQFDGHTLVDQAAHPGTQARFPGNEVDELPMPGDTLSRATGPHAMIMPLARYAEMDPRDVDWLFQSLDAYDDQFFHSSGTTGFGWEATIPWDSQDSTYTWQASDGQLKYADMGRPYEALNAAYIVLAAYDALNPDAPLASLNSQADVIGDAARYFDASVGQAFDYGDAPDDPAVSWDYPTLRTSDGAAHVVVPGVYLGAAVDDERDGYPSATAAGDDQDVPGDDEEGVVFAKRLVQGTMAPVAVTASTDGLLNAWIDWNGDGDWADTGEQIFADRSLVAGENNLSIAVPVSASLTGLDQPTFARFRFSTAAGLSFTGLAPDGEVEDYPVLIKMPTVLSIEPAAATNYEGDAGTTPFTFTVTRTGDTLEASSVQYAVTGSGSDPADAADFGGSLPSGTVVFASGETSQTIDIAVSGDTTVESDEQFTVTLSGASNASILVGSANGVIEDDDSPLIGVTVEFTDSFGSPLSPAGTVAPHDDFRIYVYAQDLRQTGTNIGVFSTFVDVVYAGAMIRIDSIVPLFTDSHTGSIDATAGVVDEVGGQVNTQPSDRDPQPVFYLEATALAGGLTNVDSNAGENELSENVLFGMYEDVRDRTQFGSAQLNIAVRWQYSENRFDVNASGYVSAEDVLTLINRLNRHAGDPSLPALPDSPPPYYDVNGDGYCTAADVLEVITYINHHAGSSGEGEMASGQAAFSMQTAGPVAASNLSPVVPNAARPFDTAGQSVGIGAGNSTNNGTSFVGQAAVGGFERLGDIAASKVHSLDGVFRRVVVESDRESALLAVLDEMDRDSLADEDIDLPESGDRLDTWALDVDKLLAAASTR